MKSVLIGDDIKGWRDYNSNIVQELLEDVDIQTADCAQAAYDILLKQNPLDIIITDLQMETDFEPKYAGEWLIEQIRTFSCYKKTKIIIISASYNVRNIAEHYDVLCIPKSTALKCLSAYQEALL